eukprot:g5484.t1
MRILVVDAFSKTSAGRKKASLFKAEVQKVFDNLKIHVHLQMNRMNDLGDFIYEEDTAFSHPMGVTKFDRLDFIFIGGNPTLLPWAKCLRQVFILVKMCYLTNKCLFASSFASHMVANICCTGGEHINVINGKNGRGGALGSIANTKFDKEFHRSDMFFDNKSGDLYHFNPEKAQWLPFCHSGLRQRAKYATHLPRKYRPKEPFGKHAQPSVVPSLLHEVKLSIRTMEIQHWAFKGLKLREFLVPRQNLFDIDEKASGSARRKYFILADSDQTLVPQIIEAGNLFATQFSISSTYPETCQIMNNYVRQKYDLMNTFEYLDVSSAFLSKSPVSALADPQANRPQAPLDRMDKIAMTCNALVFQSRTVKPGEVIPGEVAVGTNGNGSQMEDSLALIKVERVDLRGGIHSKTISVNGSVTPGMSASHKSIGSEAKEGGEDAFEKDDSERVPSRFYDNQTLEKQRHRNVVRVKVKKKRPYNTWNKTYKQLNEGNEAFGQREVGTVAASGPYISDYKAQRLEYLRGKMKWVSPKSFTRHFGKAKTAMVPLMGKIDHGKYKKPSKTFRDPDNREKWMNPYKGKFKLAKIGLKLRQSGDHVMVHSIDDFSSFTPTHQRALEDLRVGDILHEEEGFQTEREVNGFAGMRDRRGSQPTVHFVYEALLSGKINCEDDVDANVLWAMVNLITPDPNVFDAPLIRVVVHPPKLSRAATKRRRGWMQKGTPQKETGTQNIEAFSLKFDVYFTRMIFYLIAFEPVKIIMMALRNGPSAPSPILELDDYPQTFTSSRQRDEVKKTSFTLGALLRNQEHEGYRSISQPDAIELKLKEYQKQTVAWMHDREFSSGGLNNYYWEERKWLDSVGEDDAFYYMPSAGELRLERPPMVRGGLLCEEMGLGKSLEVVCTIMLDKQKCQNENIIVADGWVENLYRCNTTLIVAPLTLISQWEQEIRKSLKNPDGLRIHVHEEKIHGRSSDLDVDNMDRKQLISKLMEPLNRDVNEAEKAIEKLSLPGWRHKVGDRLWRGNAFAAGCRQRQCLMRKLAAVLRRGNAQCVRVHKEEVDVIGRSLGEVNARRIGRFPALSLEFVTALRLATGIEAPSKASSSNPLRRSPKVRKVLQMIHSCSAKNEKVVVFSQYVTTIKHLSFVLVEEDIPHTKIVRGDNAAFQKSAVATFTTQRACKVFLLHAGAAAAGLTLTAAQNVILLEPFVKAGDEKQAFARCHRMGQTKHVNTYVLYMKHSIEERMLAYRKQENQFAEDANDLSVLSSCDAEVVNRTKLQFLLGAQSQ